MRSSFASSGAVPSILSGRDASSLSKQSVPIFETEFLVFLEYLFAFLTNPSSGRRVRRANMDLNEQEQGVDLAGAILMIERGLFCGS